MAFSRKLSSCIQAAQLTARLKEESREALRAAEGRAELGRKLPPRAPPHEMEILAR
jgi:hypothetical protein